MVEQCNKVYHPVYNLHASPGAYGSREVTSTKDDLRLFRERVLYWMDRFGLVGWDEVFNHKDTDQEGQNAAIGWDVEGRTCTFFLHKNVEEPLEIEKEAFHVVGHLFLARLSVMAMDRHMTAREFREELNAVLRTLQGLLLSQGR
jgi:hypothetical protein